jgi:cytochrome c6
MAIQTRVVLVFMMISLSLFFFISTFSITLGGDLGAGQKIFETKCAQCHGKDAKGSPKMLKVLKVEPAKLDLTGAEASKLSQEEVVKTVTAGKKKMPKYKGKLTDDQIESAAKYVKSLQDSGK